MRWFYAVLIAAIVAGGAIGFAKLENTRTATVEAIVAASLIVIFIALFGFLAKSKD
jgi:hypothetical protein